MFYQASAQQSYADCNGVTVILSVHAYCPSVTCWYSGKRHQAMKAIWQSRDLEIALFNRVRRCQKRTSGLYGARQD